MTYKTLLVLARDVEEVEAYLAELRAGVPGLTRPHRWRLVLPGRVTCHVEVVHDLPCLRGYNGGPNTYVLTLPGRADRPWYLRAQEIIEGWTRSPGYLRGDDLRNILNGYKT